MFSNRNVSNVHVSRFANALSWLDQHWQRFSRWLNDGQTVQIHKTADRTGKIWWNVYDPTTGRSAVLPSEQEVMVWLEERYHQSLSPTFNFGYDPLR